MIRLITKNATKTSRGMLSKGWYDLNGELVLVKGNTSGGWEPYSESMVYRIGRKFGLDVVEYWLMPANLFPDIKVFGIEHVSVCRNFIPSGFQFIPAEAFITGKFKGEPKDWYIACKEYESLLNLSSIIWLDSVVGEDDRHLNNFGVMRNFEGKIIPAPIFDNGASLLACVSDSEVVSASRKYIYDKAKPFRTKHKIQRKLFHSPKFNRVEQMEIMTQIKPILDMLPAYRAGAIINYINWRWNEYVLS